MRATANQLFGDDFYQDLQVIRISKSSLFLSNGMHSAQALLAAIVLRARHPFEGSLTDSSNQPLTANGETLEFSNAQLFDYVALQYWQNQIAINRRKQQVYQHSYYLTVRHELVDNEQSINLGKLE